VNDVLQHVSGESQPVPLWRTASTEDLDSIKDKEFPLFYSLRLNLKVTGLQGVNLNCWCNMRKNGLVWTGIDTQRFLEVLVYLLVSLCQGIQVTATTPSSTALRLDTGVVALEVSNRAPTSNLSSGKLKRSTFSISDWNIADFLLCSFNPNPIPSDQLQQTQWANHDWCCIWLVTTSKSHKLFNQA